MKTRPVRRSAGLAAITLVAASLLTVGGAAPAGATPGCTDETPPNILTDGCDDSTPPETVLSSSSAPNAAGFVTTSTMTFTFSATVTDGDAGPFGFECATATPAAPSPAWQPCTSPVTLSGLADSGPGAYGFSVRAVDTADRAIDPDTLLGVGTVEDTPDEDPTPAGLSWGQDTKAPFVFVTRSAYDEDTPTQPVVTTPTLPLRLNSNEPGARFECTDDGRPVTCTGGRWDMPATPAGRHVVSARAIDRAGNASAWSAPVEFFVPLDLTRSRGWRAVSGRDYLDGDALRAARPGSRLVLPRTTVGELRLVAPSGPRMGKVRLRVGRRDWHVVDLSGPRAALRQYVVIDRYSGVRTGRIVIEALGGRVLVDGVVARPNRFPTGAQRR
ncbi:hypothetical protein [Nocardioides zeicaulis]|uniref:Bacterial Ig-like domain-containing protein n=1 Tax=Nocardioides zeicaulis TaxID=1776857 RepID=A0ABV6E196_9ACTN